MDNYGHDHDDDDCDFNVRYQASLGFLVCTSDLDCSDRHGQHFHIIDRVIADVVPDGTMIPMNSVSVDVCEKKGAYDCPHRKFVCAIKLLGTLMERYFIERLESDEQD